MNSWSIRDGTDERVIDVPIRIPFFGAALGAAALASVFFSSFLFLPSELSSRRSSNKLDGRDWAIGGVDDGLMLDGGWFSLDDVEGGERKERKEEKKEKKKEFIKEKKLHRNKENGVRKRRGWENWDSMYDIARWKLSHVSLFSK